MNEICLGVTPVTQPAPARNKGGDCFACALTAALRWIHQDPTIPFDVCWELFLVESAGGSRVLSNSWSGLRSALYASIERFGAIEIVADMPKPQFDPEESGWCWFQAMAPEVEYARLLEGYLRSGFVAFTEMEFAGRGPVVAGKWNTNDHFALIDGVRSYWKPVAAVPGASSHTTEVHVVCSARGAYWIDTREFLFKHGGGAWWLARKDVR